MPGFDSMDANEQRNARARRLRNYAIAAVLGALVVLFYVMTIVRVHP
jgi:cell division septal protein FtsQ